MTPGRLLEIGGLDVSAGGAVANTGLTLHKLGVDVELVGNISDDLIGQMIVDTMKKYHSKYGDRLTVKEGLSSSYTVVLSAQGSDRILLSCIAASDTFGIEDLDFTHIRTCKLFHLGYPTLLRRLYTNNGDELSEIFRRVNELDVITSLDTTLPAPNSLAGQVNWKHFLERTLPYVDIFVPSIEEALFMLRRELFDQWQGEVMAHVDLNLLNELADEIISMSAGVTGFKLGEYGLYAQVSRNRDHLKRLDQLPIKVNEWLGLSHYHPAFAVEVAGTTGAGDSAYSGLLAALLWGYSLKDTVRFACAVGASSVEGVTANSAIESWEVTNQRIIQGWPIKHDTRLDMA